jgi:hypothetical protein
MRYTSKSKFILEKAEDESVDDLYRLEGTEITVQVAPYAAPFVYSVGEWLPDEQALVHWGEFKAFSKAKMMAIAIANGHGPAIRKANGWED